MLFFCVAAAFAQEAKPNFTGDWTLDREKSEMGEPRQGGGGGGGRGRGMGMGSFSITHDGDTLVLKRKVEFQGEERTSSRAIPTARRMSMRCRGNSVKSKTHWDGAKLVTESVMETPNGTRETKEVRSLSADGKTMTVETTSKGGFGEGTRKMVYNKKD
jgi:hypothetical protein